MDLSVREPQMIGTCLVVDDDSFDRRMVRRCIGRDRPDLDLYECETISAARDFLMRQRPDVILLDHRLPDGQGADFALELRGDRRLDDTMICVVTNSDTRLLDPAIPAMSKDALTPQSIWGMVEAFLAERHVARSTPEGRLVEEFSGSMQVTMAPAVSRMIRTLRSAKIRSRRSIPRAALNDLERLEEMLLAFSEVVSDTEGEAPMKTRSSH